MKGAISMLAKLQKLRNKKGFTLVELLVVLAILAILIAIAVPSMMGALNDARDKASLADARAAYIAYELKSSVTSTVTLSDIKTYIDKADATIAVSVTKAGNKVTEFYYQDSQLSGGGKYVKITMGDKATIESGTMPTAGALS